MRIKVDNLQLAFSKTKNDRYGVFSVSVLECLHREVILIPVIYLSYLIVLKNANALQLNYVS